MAPSLTLKSGEFAGEKAWGPGSAPFGGRDGRVCQSLGDPTARGLGSRAAARLTQRYLLEKISTATRGAFRAGLAGSLVRRPEQRSA
jgi:hypothetical protein